MHVSPRYPRVFPFFFFWGGGQSWQQIIKYIYQLSGQKWSQAWASLGNCPYLNLELSTCTCNLPFKFWRNNYNFSLAYITQLYANTGLRIQHSVFVFPWVSFYMKIFLMYHFNYYNNQERISNYPLHPLLAYFLVSVTSHD